MGEFSVYHWLIVLAVIVLLFGGRKIPELFKGLGEGVRLFKAGLSGEARSIDHPSSTKQTGESKKSSERD
jgi:sec-independent protein translocase protein TatA